MQFSESDWRIIGHQRAIRTLSYAAHHGQPAHAYLVTGASRVGKHTLGRAFAAALNCNAPPESRPCYECASCRMTVHEGHPDFIVVKREEDRRLTVEQVRDARSTVEWRPYQGRFKVYLFVDADEMSEGASNALLKTLEEPPPQVVIILTASQEDSVPATVLSRCRILSLQLVPRDALVQGLQRLYGASAGEAGQLSGLAAGRPGWAIDALRAPDMRRERELALDRAVALSDGTLASRLLLAGEAVKGENFLASRMLCLTLLRDMQAWWRDLLLVASSAKAAPHLVEHSDELKRQAQKRGIERVLRGLHEIEATVSAVERNVTPRLALEALILRLG